MEGVCQWREAGQACRRLAQFGLQDAAATTQHAAWLDEFDELSFRLQIGMSGQDEAKLRRMVRDPYKQGLLKFAAADRLGRHLYSAGRYSEAEQCYARLRSAPAAFRQGRYYSDSADMLMRRGRYADAAKMLARLRASPQGVLFSTDALLAKCYGQWAQSAAQQKRPNWALVIKRFGQARRYSKHAYLPDYLAACERVRRFAGAAKAIDGALAALAVDAPDPGDWIGVDPVPPVEALTQRKASICLNWAEHCRRRKEFDKVADLYRQAKALDPTAKPGLSASDLDRDDEESAQALLDEANGLLALNRNHGRALVKLQTIVLNFPATTPAAEAEFRAACCYRHVGRPDRALELLGRFAKAHPNHPLATEALLQRIYLLADRGRHPRRAIDACEALVNQFPGCRQAAEACYLRGMYYALMLKDTESAVTCFVQTQVQYPDSVWGSQWAPKRLKQIADF